MKSPKIYKKKQKLADGSFVQSAKQFGSNYGKAAADVPLSMLGLDNVIQDEDYTGAGAEATKNAAKFSGVVGRVALPSMLAMAGVNPEVTAMAQQALGNELNPESNAMKAKRLAEEEAKKKAGLAAQFNTNMYQTMNDREMANYSEGGEIKGKGGPKSDSIEAEVKAKSFVVPAENAGIAATIRETFIGKNKKAKLKQEGGEEVKLSDGEHLFTPEEYKFLKTKGIDLENLAPNADYYTADANTFANGGLTPDKAKTMLRDGMANGQPLSDKQKRFFGWVAGGGKQGLREGGKVDPKEEQKKIQAERDKVNRAKSAQMAQNYRQRQADEKRISEYNARAEKGKKRMEADLAAKKSYNDYLAAEKAYNGFMQDYNKAMSYKRTATDRAIGGGAGSVDREGLNKKREELLKSLNDKKSVYEKNKLVVDNFDKTSNISAFNSEDSPYRGAEKKPTTSVTETKVNPPLTTPGETIQVAKPKAKMKAPSAPKQQLEVAQAAQVDANGFQPLESKPIIPPTPTEAELDARILSPEALKNMEKGMANANQTPTETPDGATTPEAGMKPGLAGSYLIPAYQMYAGNKMLKELGDRPVDSLDPDYLKAIESSKLDLDLARRNSRFGLTPEEQLELNQANQNALEAGRFAAKNYSGGSAANAFSLDQAAINDAFNRRVGISKANREAKMGKQGLAANLQSNYNNLMMDKSNRQRTLFGDKLNAWNVDQSAGSELLGAGMKNMTEASRYNEQKGLIDAINKKYGV